ncbi:MAG: hypothetical protein WA418_08860, partial [Bradyrhizobium sp.]
HAAGLLGMGMDVDGDDIVDLGQSELGHGRSRRLVLGFGKLIIPYNKFGKAASIRLGYFAAPPAGRMVPDRGNVPILWAAL